jgi:hypothetical protein
MIYCILYVPETRPLATGTPLLNHPWFPACNGCHEGRKRHQPILTTNENPNIFMYLLLMSVSYYCHLNRALDGGIAALYDELTSVKTTKVQKNMNQLMVVRWWWWLLAGSRCAWRSRLMLRRHLLRSMQLVRRSSRRGREAPWGCILRRSSRWGIRKAPWCCVLRWRRVHLTWICSWGWGIAWVAGIPIWHLPIGTVALGRGTRRGIYPGSMNITLPPSGRSCCTGWLR